MKFLVDFKADALDADITAYLQQHGCTVLKEWDNFDKIFLVEAASMPPNAAITERITEENHLEIKPLDVITLNPFSLTHNDPTKETININTSDTKDWWKNYSRNRPEFSEPTTFIKRKGKGINVYVMDSGIEASHPEFANANITNIYSVTPGDFSDNRGHGTAISSVIVGATCGITEANLKIVKIFDPDHTTTEHEFLDALDAIINDHVDNTYSILNASWTIPKNEWVEHKLRILEDEGVFIVAAAGNNGTSIEDVTPASMLDALTVGAYNQDLRPCDFSNYTGGSSISVTEGATNHGELDGWAPGEQIWAAGLNGTYGYVAGTSIAAGITSAVMACSLSASVYEDNGQRVESFENWKMSTAAIDSRYTIFRRPDILDLSDPKYQESVNLILTLMDRGESSVFQTQDEFAVSTRVGVSSAIIRVYEPTLTKSIEWVQPLPNTFKLLNDGRLYGNPTAAEGPDSNENYKIHTASFIRTNLDDTQETVTLTIYVMAENLVPETLPADDPIKITLQANCLGGASNCPAGSPVGGCYDACANELVCCSSQSKDSFQCRCGN